MHMVNTFLPSMIERGGGLIVNMSTGLIRTPFYNVVEAKNFAQKFVLWWIRSLGSTPEKMAAKIVGA